MIVGLFSLSFFQVPPFLVRKVFTQVFSFINVQLFNRSVVKGISYYSYSFKIQLYNKPYFLYLCLRAVAFCWEENAVHLATVNMSKLAWRNWSTGATKQLMRYLGLLPLVKRYSPCLLFSLMKGACSVYRISLGGAQAYKTGNWILGNASSNLD